MSVTQFSVERINGAANVPAEFTADDRQYTKHFKVLVDSVDDEAQTIYAHASCPKIGDAYSWGSGSDASSRVISVRINPLGGHYDSEEGSLGEWAWSVEVTYSRKGETVENPLNRPAKVFYDMEQYDAPLERDLDGNPVLNSAKQHFDPPALREDNRLIIRIEKNLATFDSSVAENFENAVNSAAFLGYDAHTLRITKISASPQEDATFGDYYAVSVEIQRRRIEYTGHQPHQAYVLDMGRYELYDPTASDPTKRWRAIKDNDGQPVMDAVPLNGAGLLKNDDEPAVYLNFPRYPTYDFTTLGIYP